MVQIGHKYIVLFLMICLVPNNSLAMDLRYSMNYIFTKYENITRASVSEGNEYSNSLVGNLSLAETSLSYNTSLSAQLASTQYLNEITADRTRANLKFNMLWSLRPKSIEWFFSDVFTQSTISSLVGDTPDNKQNVNVLRTGPNFKFRLGSRQRIDVEPRYENYRFELSNNNSRVNNTTRWFFIANPTINLGFSHFIENTHFSDVTLNPNYSRNNIDAFISSNKGTTNINLGVGTTVIKGDDFSTVRSPRAQLSITHQLRRLLTASLVLSKDVNDTGTTIKSRKDNSNTFLDSQSLDFFQQEGLRFSLYKRLDYGDLSFTYINSDRSYNFDTSLDQSLVSSSVLYNVAISRMIFISAYAQQASASFSNTVLARDYDNFLYRINARYVMKRNLSINFIVSKIERISDNESDGFEDFNIGVSIQYSSL